MSELNEEITEQLIPEDNSELETLLNRASIMGIKHHPKIGVDKLKEKIRLQLDLTQDQTKPALKLNTALTKEQYDRLQNKTKRKSAGALVRIRLTCMNPDKKNWPGEVFSSGSAKLGTFKKYVPFKSEHPYHVPKIIYEMMKERKFTVFKEVPGPKGNNKVMKGHLIPEFAIELLPNLTTDEIKDLAKQQAMAGSI